MIKNLIIISLSLFFVACGGGGGSSAPSIVTVSEYPLNVSAETAPASSKIPTQSSLWNIQLTGTIDESFIGSVSMYEVDLFDSSADLIDRLKDNGNSVVICYFNAGAYENWRSDANSFPSSVLGNSLSGYPDENWLNVRSSELMSIMEARLDLAVAKGCDGVDPDNMNGWEQDLNSDVTGFDLSSDDQLAYNRYIANEARERGLSVALKNDWDQIDDLVAYYDFAVSEQCFDHGECDKLQPFIDAGKGVFDIEYATTYVNDATARASMCADSNSRSFSTLVMTDDLNVGSRLFSCN